MRCFISTALRTVLMAFAIDGHFSAAQAQGAPVKAIFEKHNLLGTFAWDCAKPASRDNRYYVHRPLETGHVQRDMMSGPNTRDFAVIWEGGFEAGRNQITLSGVREGQPVESTYMVERDRIRVVESTVGGKKEIAGGTFTAGGGQMPWAYRCSAPAR